MGKIQYERPEMVFVQVKQGRVICTSMLESSAKMNVTYEEEDW